MSRKPHYNHIRVTLTPTPPPPKTWTTPTYHLERYTIRRNVKTVNVQLHGLRANEKRTESMSFPLLPHVTDTELVRAAVFCSPNKWTVPFGINVKQFNGKFSSPLNAQLLAALMGRPQPSSPGGYSQPPVSPHAAPTVTNLPVSQPYDQSAIPQPGQFQQPVGSNQIPTQPGKKGAGLWRWYRTRSRRTQIVLACLILAVLFFSGIVSAASSNTNQTATPTPTAPSQQAVVVMSPTPTQIPSPTPVPTQQPTPTPTPKPTPKPAIAPTHAPAPTQPPKPTPCPGINCNPWGYNFSAGNLIYNPPSNFCDYFNCIASFWQHTNGYVDECVDGTYSHSGGVRGACSYHGGELRPLYAH